MKLVGQALLLFSIDLVDRKEEGFAGADLLAGQLNIG